MLLLAAVCLPAQKKTAVMAYYAGSPERLDSFDARQLTHIIYCFGHLDGDRLHIKSSRDTLMIQKMVAMKVINPSLKVLLSLGGWGGCQTCSAVFSTEEGRKSFAQSVQELTSFFQSDGIDLDWEYPTVPGYPGHPYSPADRDNFTALVKQLRATLGKRMVITFAAGGFQSYINEAVDWRRVMPQVNYVNLMSYDLVSGFSTTTGHHTPLYSSEQQSESTDNAVQALLKAGVPAKKIIIGAAFYSRIWAHVPPENNGLYQSGQFLQSVDFRQFPLRLSTDSGFVFYWDSVAHAPYAYHPEKQLFATFDDKRSVAAKINYVLRRKLGGIMFWQLGADAYTDGLLQTISETIEQRR